MAIVILKTLLKIKQISGVYLISNIRLEKIFETRVMNIYACTKAKTLQITAWALTVINGVRWARWLMIGFGMCGAMRC